MRYIMLLAFVGLFSCGSKKQEASTEATAGSLTIEVENTLGKPRTGVMVHVAANDLRDGFDAESFVVLDGTTEVPAQFNKKDKGKEGIVFVVDQLGANEKKTYTIKSSEAIPNRYKKRTQAEISVRTGGKFENNKYVGGSAFQNIDSLRVPDEHTDHSFYIRYEGPGWESDLIGYRLYLDWRNAIDIFAKTTDDMVLQNVGQDGFDSYHEMADWGMDVLKVGKSLGIGSLSTFHDGQANRVDKTDSVISKILENGAVYSAVQNDYFGWEVAGSKVDVLSKLSIHAGTRLSHYEVTLEGDQLDNMSTGIGKDLDKAKLFTSEGDNGKWGYIATYGDQSLNDDKLGLAVLFSNDDFVEFTEDEHSHVVKLKPSAGKIDYYFLGAWELEPNGITNEEDFIHYINKTAEELANPVKVSVK